MRLLDRFHGRYVHSRRVDVLSEQLAPLLPACGSVLDVGAGDGKLAGLIVRKRPDVRVQGIDVLVRAETAIPVAPFDGTTLPYGDASFDAVMFVDVLHHAEDPLALLTEARRVARTAVIIKDHTKDGLLAGATLRFMDRVGNARHGVSLPYNYWPRRQWQRTFAALKLRVTVWKDDLGMYPFPASCVFSRSLHFVARLEPEKSHAADPAPQPAPGGQ